MDVLYITSLVITPCLCLAIPVFLLWPQLAAQLSAIIKAHIQSVLLDNANDDIKDDKDDGGMRHVLKLVLDLARPELKLIILVTTASITASISELISPILLGYALDLVVKHGGMAPIKDLLIFFTGIFTLELLIGACEYIKAGTNNDIGDFVRQRARSQIFKSVLHQDQAFLDQTHSSTFNLRFTMLDELHALAGHLIPDLSGAVLTLSITCGYSFKKNPMLGTLVLLIFSLQGLIECLLHKKRKSLHKKLIAFEQEWGAFREESWASIKTVKSFRAEDRQSKSFDAMLDKDRVIRCQLTQSHAVYESIAYLMTSSSYLIWFIGLLALILAQRSSTSNGTSSFLSLVRFASLGELSAFLAIVSKIRGAANRFLRAITGLQKASAKLSQSLNLIHREPAMKAGTQDLPLISATLRSEAQDRNPSPPDQRSLRVDFQDVYFSYASRPDLILKGLSLSLEAGQVTALCGPSGGGKSTISALTLRLYDPSKGRVSFNGLDLQHLSNNALSGLISVVSQEPVLFSDSIEANIKFGNPRATEQQVLDAAIAANCHEFIAAFPLGYEMQVGERGVRLSGGQKQRIAIARALLCNPALLILDEASSALDAESEYLVQEATERVMAGRTVMIVAHRLSTIRLADKIFVISGGRAVEEGRHEELIAKEGVYHQLVNRQLMPCPYASQQ